MYYEHESAGTPLLSSVRVPVGARIGGNENVEFVDLSKSSLDRSDVQLRSDDYLASISEAPKMSRGDFPELRDLFDDLGSIRPVGDRITVVDSSGSIVSRYTGDRVDLGTREVSKADDVRLTDYLKSTYENLRPRDESGGVSPYGDEGEGGLGGLGGLGDPGMFGGDSGMNYGGGMGRGSSMGGSSGRRGSSRGSSRGRGESGF